MPKVSLIFWSFFRYFSSFFITYELVNPKNSYCFTFSHFYPHHRFTVKNCQNIFYIFSFLVILFACHGRLSVL